MREVLYGADWSKAMSKWSKRALIILLRKKLFELRKYETEQKAVKIKLLINDQYLKTEHGLLPNYIYPAKPSMTSTGKLKGYTVASRNKNTPIFLREFEVEVRR